MTIKKKSIFPLFLILLSISMFNSCASKPEKEKVVIPEPQWITDKKGVFPDSLYLSQLGTGTTPTEARNNSIAQLASYFNTEVKSLVEGDTFTYNSTNEPGRVDRTIKSSVVTYTDLELFALETEEPYFLARENKWYCCAHINRKDAWNQYEPLVRDNKNAFYSIYSLAKETPEPLERIKIYSQTERASEEFLGSLYRASLFSKKLTDEAFGQDRAVIASIPGFVQKERNNCVMYVNVPQDLGGTVSSTVNGIFSKIGFTTSDNQKKSYYTVDAVVDFNEIKEEDLFVFYPSVKISVKSEEKTVYVYENKLDRVMSYNESKAKKSACDGIAELLDKELAADFKSIMGLSE